MKADDALAQAVFDIFQKDRARGGEHHRAAGVIEQADAKGLFEAAQMMRDRADREAGFGGDGLYRAGFCDELENFQPPHAEI